MVDPNANLSEQSYLLGYGEDIDKRGKARLLELRKALREWIRGGGFAPVWSDYPDATSAFNMWRARRAVYRGKL